ncbi:MAG: hypothetical protein ABW179_03655 [Methylobacterium sp.]
MKAYWNDCGEGPTSDAARDVDLREARLIWSDEVRGVAGNFLGLIDDEGRTVQFYFVAGPHDDVDDASHLQIVLMDFPLPEQQGSYERYVAIGEVQRLIELAFRDGADHRRFGALTLKPW